MNRILLLLPLITSMIDDVMDSFDPERLDEAIQEYKDMNGTTSDEAQRALAMKFDEAFDWQEALSHAGVPVLWVGEVLESIDYNIWYYAIKVHCKARSRKRDRTVRRFRGKVAKIMNEYLAPKAVPPE